MGKVNLYGVIRTLIMGNSSKTTFMVKVSIRGQMEGCIRVVGSIIAWKEKENSRGWMVENMLENI